MLKLACFMLPLVLLAGCGGPSARIDKVSGDMSGDEPVLQVWTRAHKIEAGADAKVVVGWNKWLGTGPVTQGEIRADGTCVVKVADWKPGASDHDKLTDMRVEFTYNNKVLAKRVLTTPTDFANAFHAKHPDGK